MKIFRAICAMALVLGAIACEKEPEYGNTSNTAVASLGTPANNEIWFTTADNRALMALNEEAFDAKLADIEYSDYGINIIRFESTLTTIDEEAFYNCRNLNNISLPTTITTIGDRAFAECIGLECMTLGDQIRRSGKMAFDNCTLLNSLHIPSTGDWCNIEFADPFSNPLYYCGAFIVNGKKIKEVIIPEWIKSINPYAFYNYSSMASVEIPASITAIGKEAFAGCESLSKVYIKDVAKWCNIDFADETANPLSLAGSLYIDGQKATQLNLSGVETIKERAFIRCTSLQKLVAEEVSNICLEAFRGCDALTTVTLGENTQNIYDRAFMGCMALKSVTIHATTPPTLYDTYVFEYNDDERKIRVPSEALNTYLSDSMWSIYADSIEAIK